MIHDFPPGSQPYCVFTVDGGPPRIGVGVGTDIVDLDAMAKAGRVSSVDPGVLVSGRLNELLAAGRRSWTDLRSEIPELIEGGPRHRQAEVSFRMPWTVADYVDFYSSRNHAENVGRIFRPDAEPLLPNWLHLPVAYHGRSGTVVVDGTPIHRPAGQRRGPDGEIVFGPSTRLDIELEVGFVLGGGTAIGRPVPIDQAAEHLFGVVLVNDWSARDIQAWEYVPLGPFLGKSFATSVSAWVMPFDALEQVRVMGPPQTDPEPLPYLRCDEPWHLAIDLEVWMKPRGAAAFERIVAVDASTALYWSPAQQLAHMTVNGASVRPGDLFASGTVSGSERSERGSLLELTWGWREPFSVAGFERKALENGDEVELRGSARGREGGRIPLGSVGGRIVG